MREAATFAIPHPRLGQELAVAVVLEADHTATARELRSWMLDHLALHKTPRHIWFAAPDELPRTPSGKVRRGELAERFLRSGNQPDSAQNADMGKVSF